MYHSTSNLTDTRKIITMAIVRNNYTQKNICDTSVPRIASSGLEGARAVTMCTCSICTHLILLPWGITFT